MIWVCFTQFEASSYVKLVRWMCIVQFNDFYLFEKINSSDPEMDTRGHRKTEYLMLISNPLKKLQIAYRGLLYPSQ
jgi:hypothetical protein